MGQTMTSETLSISGGDGYKYYVGFQMKPMHRGRKKTIYKGALLGHGPRAWEKVVVKCFTDIEGTKKAWGHEVTKADLTKQMAAIFTKTYPTTCKIKVILPGITQMDKSSKFNKWLDSRQGHRKLGDNEWISVEEYIPGKLVRFCPWKDESQPDNTIIESEHLETFSHFSYNFTNGRLVACDFQGVIEKGKETQDRYVFTDSLLHSINKLHGQFDEGILGITEFFKKHKCSTICKDWPKPAPLTPPPSFDEALASDFSGLSLTPLPTFENVLLPSNYNYDNSEIGNTGRRRHRSANQARMQQRSNLPDISSSFGRHNRRRSSLDVIADVRRGRTNPDYALRNRNNDTLEESLEHSSGYRPRSSSSREILTQNTSSTSHTESSSSETDNLHPDMNDAPPSYDSCVHHMYDKPSDSNRQSSYSDVQNSDGVFQRSRGTPNQSQALLEENSALGTEYYGASNIPLHSSSSADNITRSRASSVKEICIHRSRTDPEIIVEDRERANSDEAGRGPNLRMRRLNSWRLHFSEDQEVGDTENLAPLVVPTAPPIEHDSIPHVT